MAKRVKVNLETEIARLSGELDRRRGAGVASGVAKTFSLVPVQAAHSIPLRGMPRPSDQNLLRAYNESPWLHIKVYRLASAWASLRYKIMVEQKSGIMVDIPASHPLGVLLENPNPFLSGWDFRFLSELYLRAIGQCYWHFTGSSLKRELWLYPPNWVTPILGNDRNVAGYDVQMLVTGGVRVIRVPASQMVWVRTPDPLEPYSRGLGDALSIASEVDTFELASESDRRFFENDASPPGALVVPGRLTEDESGRMRDDFQNKQGGPENQGRPMVLFGGMDWKTFRQGRREMDFIDGQKYLRDVIIAGVHKHVLGITEDVNFAAAKAADYQVSKWELAPRVPMWQNNMRVLARLYDERLRVIWDNPVPVDETIELTKSNEGLLRGAITRAEWRKTNGYPELPADLGDVFIIPPGLIVVPMNEGGDVRPVESEEIPPEPAPEGGAPEKTIVPKVSVGPARPPVKKAAFDSLHENWKRVIDEINDNLKTEDTMKVLVPVYEAVMESRLKDAKEELGIDVSLAINDPDLLHYMRNAAGERIRHVDDKTRDTVREQLEEGVRAGETLGELEERLNSIFVIATEHRAETIARTETIDASNATAYATYARSGVVEQVEWLLAPDYLDDDDDGQCESIEAGGPVDVGREFAPGIGFPPAHPNCRCAVAPIVIGEEDDKSVTESKATARQLDYSKGEAYQGSLLSLTDEGKAAAQKTITTLLDELAGIDKAGVGGLERREARIRAANHWLKNDAFPHMQRVMEESVGKEHLRPALEGLDVFAGRGVNGDVAYYKAFTDQKIAFPRETLLDTLDLLERAAKSGVLDGHVDAWRIDAVFHEVAHALIDGFPSQHYTRGAAFVEGLNQQLGSKFTASYLDSIGVKTGLEAQSYLEMGIGTERYSYYNAVRNTRNLFLEAGINVNDERVLARALHAFTAVKEPSFEEGAASVYRAFEADLQKRKITEQNWRRASIHANSFSTRSREAIADLLIGGDPVFD